jgi:hypothetical protein
VAYHTAVERSRAVAVANVVTEWVRDAALVRWLTSGSEQTATFGAGTSRVSRFTTPAYRAGQTVIAACSSSRFYRRGVGHPLLGAAVATLAVANLALLVLAGTLTQLDILTRLGIVTVGLLIMRYTGEM